MTALVCMRLGDMSRLHPAQENRRCDRCGETVGIYPSGLKALKADPAIEIVCLACARRDHNPGDVHAPAGPVEELLQEIRDSMTRQ